MKTLYKVNAATRAGRTGGLAWANASGMGRVGGSAMDIQKVEPTSVLGIGCGKLWGVLEDSLDSSLSQQTC